MNPPDRESILCRFTARLDEALAHEDAPSGIPPELLDDAAAPPEGDLYAVQAALTALTQEVKLQGRSFKQLSEAVAPVAAVAALAPDLRAVLEQARERAQGEVLDLLLDLHDRMVRGEETAIAAIAAPRPWWRIGEGKRASEVVTALTAGYALTRARLDEALAGFGVSEIECGECPFDAATMHAVGVEYTDRVEEGTVVEVVRRGYEWNGKVHRPADVRVARRPSGAVTEPRP
jgi:molecular chaperone GrpE